jgi:hypothetical protein
MKRGLALGLVALAACQPIRKNGADVRSLDNFTRADGAEVDLNRCGMELEGLSAVPPIHKAQLARVLAHDDGLKLAVASALTAVPPSLAQPFFDAGGTIEVTPNAEDLCAGLPLSAAERRFAGEARHEVKTCWRQERLGQPPIIYVQADAATIRHALVRAFAFLYGELFIARIDGMIAAKMPLSPAIVKAAASYRTATRVVGDALYSDMRKQPAVEARLRQYRADDAAAYARVATAEAIDSYFCSPATQLAFRNRFPLTYRAFVGNDQKGLAAAFGTPWFQ